jgi:hypothetical protein
MHAELKSAYRILGIRYEGSPKFICINANRRRPLGKHFARVASLFVLVNQESKTHVFIFKAPLGGPI